MENKRESRGGARKVNVRRDAEFLSDIEGHSAELVDNERDKVALGHDGFEEVAKRGKRATNGKDDDGFGFGVAWKVIQWSRREEEVVDSGG